MREFIAAWAVVLTTSLGAAAQAGSAGDRALATVSTFIRANETADIDLLMNTFDEDANIFFPGEAASRVSGKAGIRQGFGALFKQRSGPIVIKPVDIQVQVFDDIALVTAHLQRSSTTPGVSRRTFVLRRSSETWLIVYLHASSS